MSAIEKTITGTSSLVTFTNSQRVSCRGTLAYLTRQQAIFEVYNPYSVVQLSEVLNPFCILRGVRAIYKGRAVVEHIVPTGLMLIVTVTLSDAWSDLDGLGPGQGLLRETERFIADWEAAQTVHPSFQIAVAQLRNFLEEISRWLQSAEHDRPSDPHLDREFIEEIDLGVAHKFNALFNAFEEESAKLLQEEYAIHRASAQRELHPLLLCSPFIHRCFSKPLGYAGDYEMLNMALRDPYEGPGIYAKLLNASILKRPPPQAYRNRINLLVERLNNEAIRVKQTEKRPLQMLNVGCGPVNDLAQFMREYQVSEGCEFTLMDFNAPTLDFARNRIEQLIKETGRRVKTTVIPRSINELLEEAKGRKESSETTYDLIFCAGLFDYFSPRICGQLTELFYSWVNPGGLVVTTNVENSNLCLYMMEFLMEWHLIYRNDRDMLALTPGTGQQSVLIDKTGINVFLDVRKPSGAVNK